MTKCNDRVTTYTINKERLRTLAAGRPFGLVDRQRLDSRGLILFHGSFYSDYGFWLICPGAVVIEVIHPAAADQKQGETGEHHAA